MITGVNTDITHEGLEYHVQVEDLPEGAELEVRVYVGGKLVFQKRHSYQTAVEGLANPKHIQAAALEELSKLLAVVKAAIVKGRIKG
jgi:hypothetical protein